jgi:hypothetical protein
MKKTYLLKYEPPLLSVLADYSIYYLFTETIWFWGLFKTKNKSEYKIYNHQDLKTFLKHWDNLIKTKKVLV